jgi:hypothetical protein
LQDQLDNESTDVKKVAPAPHSAVTTEHALMFLPPAKFQDNEAPAPPPPISVKISVKRVISEFGNRMKIDAKSEMTR